MKSGTAHKTPAGVLLMSVFVPFPQGVQVWILFLLDSKVVSNRLWFYNTDRIPTSGDLQGLANGVFDWHASLIMPYLSDQLELAAVVAYDWSTDPQPFEVAARSPVFGSVANESLSANVALIVPFRWDNPNRRLRRNKNYVPGVPEQEITLNTPSATIQNALFEAYAALIDAARVFDPGDFWYWVVTSAVLGNVTRSEMYFGVCIGPYPRPSIILGQRRKRLD